MRVLCFCDDQWHPESVVKNGLFPLETEGFDIVYVEDMSVWRQDMMEDFRVVILAKSNNFSSKDNREWATEEAQSVFEGYVQNGGGLLVIHSGTAGYAKAQTLRRVIGGVFAYHPEQCPVTLQPLGKNAITEGFEPFTVKDEHYFMEMDYPNDLQVFLTSSSKHGTQPAGWTRNYGSGKVCVLTPGHNVDVWLHPSFQLLLRNSLNWLGCK